MQDHKKTDEEVEPMTQRNGRCGKVRQVKMRTRARDREVIRGRKLSTWDVEDCSQGADRHFLICCSYLTAS